MPPSRCCTLLRLPSTLMMALPTTAPLSGAVAAQDPMTPKNNPIMIQPASATCLIESLGAPSLGGGPSSNDSITLRMARAVASIYFRIRALLPCRALNRMHRHRPGQARHDLGARPEHLGDALPEHEQFVDDANRARPMRDDHHRGAAL